MIQLIILSNYFQIKWGLFILIIILFALGYVFYKLTGGYTFKYFNKIKSKQTSQFLLSVQCIISVLFAFILPNNFLTKYKFFHDSFEKNQLWIPISMIAIFGLTLFIIGMLFNICCNIFLKESEVQEK